ncbi:MAG: ABC transporter substrate-binding protein, partial [Lachnospiraceae bacterium]|nr:ABC transporter substrate-binding protein [Lachnospiraceae bacterium]
IGSTQKVTVPLDGANEANMFGFGVCMDMLVYTDTDGSLTSDILESWESTDEGLTMTLKEGVNFTDGRACTAEDVLWTFLDSIERGAGSDNWESVFDWDNAEISNNDLSLFIPTFEPYAPGIISLTTGSAYIKSKSYVEEHPYEDPIWWDVVEGTGPYECVEQIDGAYSLYRLRDNYWDKDRKFKFDEIQFNYYSDQNAMAIELQNGVIDVALDINDYYYKEFSDNPDYVTKLHSEANMTTVSFDETMVEAFKDIRVREAISLAFNADEAGIVGAAGMYTVAESILPKNCFGFKSEGATLNGSDEDIARAKELMAEAGYPDGFNVKLTVRDRDADIGEYVQGALSKIGINCEFEAMEFMNYIMANRNGEIECTMGEIMSDNAGEPALVYQSFTTDQSSTLGVIFDEEFNELCKKATATVDKEARKKLVEEIQDYIYDNYYRVVLYEKAKAWVFRADSLPADFEIYAGNKVFGLRNMQ